METSQLSTHIRAFLHRLADQWRQRKGKVMYLKLIYIPIRKSHKGWVFYKSIFPDLYWCEDEFRVNQGYKQVPALKTKKYILMCYFLQKGKLRHLRDILVVKALVLAKHSGLVPSPTQWLTTQVTWILGDQVFSPVLCRQYIHIVHKTFR